MGKFLFCGYRDWALETLNQLVREFPENEFPLVRDQLEFDSYLASHRIEEIQAILCVGWSWILPRPIVESCIAVSVHPSDLPNYAGGSPIQHQILDGITATQASLFRLTPHLDLGPVVAKTPLSLEGHMPEIFGRLTTVSVSLLKGFIRDFPHHAERIVADCSTPGAITRKRLTPKDSELTPERLATLTTRQLYDFIRCREDPYPNVFVEDEEGKLFIKHVEFVPAAKK